MRISNLLIFSTLFFLGLEVSGLLPEYLKDRFISYKLSMFVVSSIGLVMIGREYINKGQDSFGVVYSILALYIPVAVGTFLFSIINFNTHDEIEYSKIINAVILISYSLIILTRGIKDYK